ncbi:MAG TPA: hypothetical protein VK835_14545 [Bacteroidia bacterium]|jgi:hypothetical protein|nr:hypothetical protein [Bacteroidia bacterium]
MKKFATALVILLALNACVAKHPKAIAEVPITNTIDTTSIVLDTTGSYKHTPLIVGVLMTCATDSTPIVVDTVVSIKAHLMTKESLEPREFKYNYTECANVPTYIDSISGYPSEIILNFKKKCYYFSFSLKRSNSHTEYSPFTVKYNVDEGKLNFSAKDSIMTLTSTVNKWARTFKYSYNKQDKILTLRSGVVNN